MIFSADFAYHPFRFEITLKHYGKLENSASDIEHAK
jgi:hypothetical protein